MKLAEAEQTPTEARRDFISKLLGIWSVVVAAPICTAILKFVTPIIPEGPATESIDVGARNDIVENSARIVRFGKEPVILVHTQSGQYKAFFARCTHLGCIVQYQGQGIPHFSCNCHGSQFDINGKNVAGPAPRPLSPLRVSIKETAVIISKV